MSKPTPSHPSMASILGLTPEKLKQYSGFTQWLAIGFILLGIAGVLVPQFFSLGVQLFLGGLLLASGVFQAIRGLTSLETKGGWLYLLGGVVSAAVGVFFLLDPFDSLDILTMLLAAALATNGLFRLVASLGLSQAPGSGFGVLNGLFGIIIGVIIWAEWPSSAHWFIGLMVAVDLLFFGCTLFLCARACRKELAEEGNASFRDKE